MKITLDSVDVQSAITAWLESQPHYLKSATELWLNAQGYPVMDSDSFVLNSDGTITVTVPVSEAAPVVAIPIAPVAPFPIASSTQGHLVQIDPPLSATGRATVFGLNYDGSNDAADNRIGFFTDPKTGKPYNTGAKELIGASLPREILLSSFGISDEWKTANPVSDEHTGTIWNLHAAAVHQFAVTHHVTLTIDSGGIFSIQNVPLVDAGPLACGPNGCTIGNLIDLTYGAAHALNTKGAAECTIELLVNGAPIEIKGWNFATKRVG